MGGHREEGVASTGYRTGTIVCSSVFGSDIGGHDMQEFAHFGMVD